MPDHLHLLVQGTATEASLAPFVKLSRQRATLATRPSRTSMLWQDGYFERTLRRDEDLVAVATYIVNNPVRAGLAREWNGLAPHGRNPRRRDAQRTDGT